LTGTSVQPQNRFSGPEAAGPMQSKLAKFRGVPYVGLGRRTEHKAAVLHTNGFDATDGSLFSGFKKNATGGNGPSKLQVGAHFQIKNDGSIEQYVDTDRRIGHAFASNAFAIGIETEDDGNCLKRWTAAQVESIIALLEELGVPPQRLKETPSDGIGWHRLFPSWNQSGHACPCNTREAQIIEEIIPGLEDEVGTATQYFKQLEKDGLNPGQYSVLVRFQWGYQHGLRNRPLRPRDAQDRVKKAGFERGKAEGRARREPGRAGRA
jgi:N-acetylmuramoyl-L-alanine amidase